MTTPDAADRWFDSRGWSAFSFQREVWKAYRDGESGLIHAATGTGKTYAAWWAPLLEYLEESADLERRDAKSKRSSRAIRKASLPLRVLWITPLRALAGDTANALAQPVEDLGLPWSIETRTGDTSSAERSRQSRKLPTALVT